MPTISPFGISDKNTYYPKLMYSVMLILIFDFSKFVFVTLLYIHFAYISPIQCTYLSYLSPFLTITPNICTQSTYIETPKCERNLECTLRIRVKVLSKFSCKILQVWSAAWNFANSSIMWSTIEKLLSWINVFE